MEETKVPNTIIQSSSEDRTPVPNGEEVEEISQAMKDNKCPGGNRITSEKLKYGGKRLQEIFELIRQI